MVLAMVDSVHHPDAVAKAALHCAGIPLTDHRLRGSVAVLSGRHARLTDEEWRALVGDDQTIVALEASSTSVAIAIHLLKHGQKAQTPVAFVQHGDRADERIEVVSLGDAALSGCPLTAPTTMIIGEVAGMARMAPVVH